MILAFRHLLGWMISAFRSREDLVLENLALHQQLLALHAQRPRHRLTALHKVFWVALRTFWSEWRKPLVLVTPMSRLSRIALSSLHATPVVLTSLIRNLHKSRIAIL